MAGALVGSVTSVLVSLCVLAVVAVVLNKRPRWVDTYIVANKIARLILVLQGKVPLRRQFFLRYCFDAKLLKGQPDEVEFIHRRLRDYFAIRPTIGRLDDDDSTVRSDVARELSNLNDASCDVLLELVNDNDRQVRLACIEGLGRIGSAMSAQTLLKIIESSAEGLSEPAIEALSSIRDVGAIPLLLGALRTGGETNEAIRQSVFTALGQMDRLDVWSDEQELVAGLEENKFWGMEEACGRALIRRKHFFEPELESRLSSGD